MDFSQTLEHALKEKQSCLMLGLDPVMEKLPPKSQEKFKEESHLEHKKNALKAEIYFDFCVDLMNATQNFVIGVKIQMAYFECLGVAGIFAVEKCIAAAKDRNLIVFIDGKRGDIGSTSEAYASAYLDDQSPLAGKALTVNPFLGSDCILPFVKKCEANAKGIFVLVKNSNPSAAEFQPPIEEKIAQKVELWGESTRSENGFSSVGAVVGATNGSELQHFRDLMPHTWILAPGIGTQGGILSQTLAVRKNNLGVIIPLSRSILYAFSNPKYANLDFKEASREAIEAVWKLQK